MHFARRLGWVMFLALVTMLGCQPASDDGAVGAASEELRTSSFEFDAILRESGRATIHANVFSDRRRPRGETVLAIHGLAETGPTYEPFARELFARRALGRRIGRVIALSLVGHGESGFPENLPSGVTFGQLTIEDNVSVVLQAVEALRARGTPARVIVGHSMGGLAIQAAQQALLAQGSSLAQLGIEHAILLAPVPAHARQWTQPPPSDLSQFVVQDPLLGPYVALSPEVWIAQAFATRAGTVAPNAPTPASVVEQGYLGFEPLTTLLQLTESPIALPDGSTVTVPRPSVDAGAFDAAHGTRLQLVSFSEDVLVPASDLPDLYAYLTGDLDALGLHEVVADDAVHSMFISNAAGLFDAAF